MHDGPSRESIVEPIALVRRHMQPGLALAQKLVGRGAHEVSALGAEVRLSDGRRVLDFGSYGVTLFGHRPPEVVDAVRAQLDRMPSSTRALANPVSAHFAARLHRLLGGGPLRRVWFGQGGTDAVEAAIKLARLATGRHRILAVEGAFHGKSMGSLAATWADGFRRGLDALLVGVTHVPVDEAAVEMQVGRGDVAAVLFEPIQGEGGVRPLPERVLQRWSQDAHAAGAMVISDEIQVGFGRCGPPSLAVAAGLALDAVLLGKALGGGVMPISAVVCTDRFYRPLLEDPFVHTATFSGHPLSCAAGLAAADLLGALQPAAERLGEEISDALSRAARAHSGFVRTVRGRGLLWGMELGSAGGAGEVLSELSRRGLLVSPCLGRPEVIRLMPPAVTTAEQLEEALSILDGALATAAARVD